MCTAVSMSVSNELQGIGSVLGSSKTVASLRRTLSADMSSKKWLSKNGFCPLKRIASSEEFQTVIDEENTATPVWNSKKEDEPPGQTDIWSIIVSQKSETAPTAVYVHPLAKRNRSLSQQSLEICTESLGSETGSDVFSSVPQSDTSDEETEEEEEAPVPAVTYNSYAVKKSPTRSFPPPLPSLSQSGLHMRSRRVDGRLVMEAVPVQAPTQSFFQAQREGGRLLLTFASPKLDETLNSDTTLGKIQEEEKEEEDMFNEVEEDDDEVEHEFEEEEEEEYDSEEENYEPVSNRGTGTAMDMKVSQPSPTRKVPTGVINVHRSALMVNKLMGLTNIDPTWSSKLEKIVGGDDQTPLTQSLPVVTRLVPPSAVASSFNTYEYGWRTKSRSVAREPTVCNHPLTQNPQPLNNKNNNFLLPKNINHPQAQQDMVLMRGNKADNLVPVFNGCKEPKRSLFIWEPHCIAT